MSRRLNEKLKMYPDKHLRDWHKMFVHMDDDKSGRITYREFLGMARQELKLLKKDAPDVKLQGVWNRLDSDDSGFITAKEFGPFMKKGMADNGPTWKERLKEQNAAAGAAVRAANSTYGENLKFSDVPPASGPLYS